MAVTAGQIQYVNVVSEEERAGSSIAACVGIGEPKSAELLQVTNDGSRADSAFADTLIQILLIAFTNSRPVVAHHGDTSAVIRALQIDPISV